MIKEVSKSVNKIFKFKDLSHLHRYSALLEGPFELSDNRIDNLIDRESFR
ncbi:unnamed protein product [Acidithrix sp. C25]|nr:unnamed protein product [Acidithrix sp. C25]